MAECPRCDSPLARFATACACGWRARAKKETDEKPRETFPCAHDGCALPAACKIKVVTGWANLCLPHYQMHFEKQADRGLAAKGLAQRPGETKSEHATRMREWCRKNATFKTFKSAEQAEDEWAA